MSLGSFWKPLGKEERLGGILAGPGPYLSVLGASGILLRPLGALLGASWGRAGASWGGLGGFRGALGAILEDIDQTKREIRALLGRSWGQSVSLGPHLVPSLGAILKPRKPIGSEKPFPQTVSLDTGPLEGHRTRTGDDANAI